MDPTTNPPFVPIINHLTSIRSVNMNNTPKSVSRAITRQADPLLSPVSQYILILIFYVSSLFCPYIILCLLSSTKLHFFSVLKTMAKEHQFYSLKLALLVSCSLLVLPFSSFYVQALNIGVQTADSAISLVWSFDHLSNYYISLIVINI